MILAVITILGILSIMGITGVSYLINRSKDEKIKNQEKTLMMAAQTYYQANIDLLPKNNCDNNSTKNNIIIAFKSKGMRKGRLTVEDIAGNIVTVTIAVNISDDSIYWALRDNNNDGKNETLVFSSSSLTGNKTGSINPKDKYTNTTSVPWIGKQKVDEPENLSYYVTTLKIEKKISPESLQYWFAGVGYGATTFTADLSNLDTKNITAMVRLFDYMGNNASSFSLTGLNNWDTSKVTDMSYMFDGIGRNATTWNIGDLSKWNTSKVTNMSNMFYCAGNNATTLNLDLSGWNTSNVTNMSQIFQNFGQYSNAVTININNWDTSNVTNMYNMFSGVGGTYNSKCKITIPKTNGGGISNTTTKLFGKTTSTYVSPPASTQFILG